MPKKSNNKTTGKMKKRVKDLTNEEILKRKYVSFEKRVLIRVLTCIFLFLIAVLFIFLSLRLNVNNKLRYFQTSNLDYKVNLKENNYYDQKTLGKDMTYIASLIDTIDVNFNYNFRTSDKLNYRYVYYVEAETIVKQEQGDNVIFSKKDKIINDKSQSLKDNDNFNINQNVKINYDKYNDVVKNFKSTYALSAKSELVLTLYVNIIDEEGNNLKSLNANNKMSINIPLTEQMIDIKMNYKEINNSDTFVANTNVYVQNKVLFMVGIIICILFVINVISLFIMIKKTKRKKTPYDILLNKILREFDRIIVESKNDIIIDEKQDIIDVKSFEELLDVRDNLEKPILFHEIHKGQKSIFVVKNNYEIYRYVLKAVDVEKRK